MLYEQINLNTGYNLLTATKNIRLREQPTVALRLTFRISSLEVFIGKSVLKICSKFSGKRTLMPKCDFYKVESNFFWKSRFGTGVLLYICYIFSKIPFPKDTSEGLLLNFAEIPDRARSSHPDVFLGKGVLKICSKFTAEHPWRSAISIKQPPREVPAKRCSENMQQIYNKVAYLIIRLFISRNHTIRSAPTPTKHKQFSDTSDINIAKKAVKSLKFCRIYCKCVMHALRGKLF